MNDPHPNVALLERVDLRHITADPGLFAEDFVFHYFNPQLPELQGDYGGVEGFGAFLESVQREMQSTFSVTPVSSTAFGDELVVTHTRNSMTRDGEPIEIDVVVVWRMVDGRIAEAWDIPSAYTRHVAHR